MKNTMNYVDKEHLSDMLDSFSKATGLYIKAVNTFGKDFLTGRSCEKSEFCNYIQNTKEGKVMCEKTYQKACKESLKWNEPYFF